MAGTSKSGRRRTPLGLKLVTGARLRPRDRRAAQRAPTTVPARPAVLEGDDLAVQYWDRIAPCLAELGMVQATDSEALGCLCLALADGERLRDEFRRTQCRAILVETITRPDGTVIRRPRPNPLLRPLSDNSRLVRQWLSEFGMTPATWASLAPAPPLAAPSLLEQTLRGR